MSVKLMSAIFAAKIMDMKDAAGNVTKASTAKQILLALADHASDDGKGAYPGLKTMVCKTALTRQCIIKTYDALKYNGMITLEGVSKLGTNNYTINTGAFQKSFAESQPRIVVNPVDQGGSPDLSPQVNPVDQGSPSRLPPPVNPVDPNHPLTTLKPSNDEDESKTSAAMKDLAHLYATTIGAITPLMADLLRNAALDFPAEWFKPAFEAAVKNNARRWNYIETILDGWKRNGFGWKPERAKTFHRSARPKDPTTVLLEYMKAHPEG